MDKDALGLQLQPGQSFPVGKIEFMIIYSMNFRKVLPYWDKPAARFLNQFNAIEEIPVFYFNPLVDCFKKYLITGGFPAMVNHFTRDPDFTRCDATPSNLPFSYKADFAKHPVMKDVARIARVFDSLPAQLARENKNFIYSLVRSVAWDSLNNLQ